MLAEVNPMSEYNYMAKVFKSANNYINKLLRVKIDEDPFVLEKYPEIFSSFYGNIREISSKKYDSIIQDVVEHVFVKRYKFEKVHVINMRNTDSEYSSSRDCALHDINYRTNIRQSTWGQVLISNYNKNIIIKLVKDDNVYIIKTNNKFKDFEILNEIDLLNIFNDIMAKDKISKYRIEFDKFYKGFFKTQINKLVKCINTKKNVIYDTKIILTEPYSYLLSSIFLLTNSKPFDKSYNNNCVRLEIRFNFANNLFEEFKKETKESLMNNCTTIEDNTYVPSFNPRSFDFEYWEKAANVRENQAFVIKQIYENKDIIYDIFDYFLKTFNELFESNYGKVENLIKQCVNDKDIDFDDIFAILKYKEQTNYIFDYIYKS